MVLTAGTCLMRRDVDVAIGAGGPPPLADDRGRGLRRDLVVAALPRTR